MNESSEPEVALPKEPIDRLVTPLTRFLHVEAASGIVLLACTVAALVLANSNLSESFLAIWKTRLQFAIGGFEMNHSLQHWINDGLMAIFFFVIGLEVKRELVLGELRDLRQAALPIAGAIGGMLVPAGVYLALQHGTEAQRGWGVPMATDIAFVVGCLAVLGKRVPLALRVMLLSLAIADDIGAVLVIAIGYTEGVDVTVLLLGIAGIGLVVGLARLGVRSKLVYLVVGALIWLCFHESGVHATIAGVVLGLLTPAHSWISHGSLAAFMEKGSHFLHGEGWEDDRKWVAKKAKTIASEAISPLESLETALHPWVSFVIMPLFALANAGVVFQLSDFGDSVAVAIVVALAVGKPAGILIMSFLAVRLGLARLPQGVGWGVILAAGFLAGIGFTMALFIANLAVTGPMLDATKVGILAGSVLSGIAGMALMLWLLPKPGRAS